MISLIGSNLLGENYLYNKNYVSGNFQLKGTAAPGTEWGLSFRKDF